MKLKAAFIFVAPEANSKIHKSTIDTPFVELISVGVKDYREAEVIANQLLDGGLSIEEAQKYHEKAQEMLSKIMSVKNERIKRWRESKEILKNQNIKARKVLNDEKKLESIAEDSVSALKKGEKISLT